MGNSDDLMSRLCEKMPTFSKGQKRLANYIMTSYDKAVFLTAARLGKAVAVSESTVVRFAMQLGYEGYPQFQEALEELVRTKLNSIQRIEIASGQMSQSKVLEYILDADAEKIKLTKDEIDKKAFEQAVETISSARTIYVIGIRSCAPIASFLSFYLNLIFDDVRNINTNNSSELFEQMIRINEEDVIIGISFPRYSVRTLKALEFANNRNAKVIAITDSKHSPMNLYSSCNLLARSDMASIVDSLVAPLSVVNALIVALCMKKKDKVINNLETLEEIWDEYQVYNKDELDVVSENVVEKFRNIGEKDE
ncbi:MAG: MurR/RpiR family transcriptional regulator [Lachnospiraceae bacterium]|uniref:MurR/RpiR family transcriptional regulator n=1 Tax=Falcatimonas sp. MSJ-15 TaxID=2841515 RepID=UPI001C10CD3F|nr:MurR/RpiR family transcriptional regulator [Falcatimonas sp. MSJ-15]MBQ5734371.1 MurR/RpiR family transcriptional regulator [Lachnospiraceae bacterium]MBU5469462.1 MurR/RpiR family transcriptional regulator [Falcatimonas sp. MSJ-15]MEE0959585.1 MurR/RpiR family transcriptional regulator [Lachnospiraceae bacterium]